MRFDAMSFVRRLLFANLLSCLARVTCYTSTLIDHILTNTRNDISHFGAIGNAISDHLMHGRVIEEDCQLRFQYFLS